MDVERSTTSERSQQDLEYRKKYGQIVAKAWADEAFRQRLLGDPKAVLKEHGIDVPADKQVRIVEGTDAYRNGDDVIHLPLPAKPRGFSDEQLDQAAGVWTCTGVSTSTRYGVDTP